MDIRCGPGRFVILPAIGALALVGLAACGGDGSGTADVGAGGGAGTELSVAARDFSFDPASLDIGAGDEVHLTMRNDGDAEHNFTFEEAGADLDVEGGKQGDVTFTAPDKAGTYTYYCKYHKGRGMTGTVTVGSGASGAPASSDDTTTTDMNKGY